MPMEMVLRLHQPGMTGFHTAGLAGLYLTLRALASRRVQVPGLTWTLARERITLRWEGIHSAAFARLIESAFRVEQGFIRLPGLEQASPPTTAQSMFLNRVLLQTFLQFGPHRKLGKRQTLSPPLDSDLCWDQDFAPVEWIRHQKAGADFLDSRGQLRPAIRLANWLYPGASQRHVAHGSTRFQEPLQLAFPLLFAPLGVIYYALRTPRKSSMSRVAMIIPEVNDLESYCEARLQLAARAPRAMTKGNAWAAILDVCCASDSANWGVSAWRTWTFGVVGWNEKQKSRTASFRIAPGDVSRLDDYRLASRLLSACWKPSSDNLEMPMGDRSDDGRSSFGDSPWPAWAAMSSVGDLIAENVATGKPWFEGFAGLCGGAERQRELSRVAPAIQELAARASYPSRAHILFLRLGRGAWRRRVASLRRRAASPAKFQSLLAWERARIHAALRRSKDRQSFLGVLSALWSRDGSRLQEKLRRVLRLVDGACWRTLQDLTALAVLSHVAFPRVPNEHANAIAEGVA